MGVSVQLVAYLNGDRIDATEMAHDPWRGLVTHPLYETLVLRECGLRASRVTRRGRQFFKHYPDVECAIEHKSESEQHLAMKQALKDRINAAPGWRAEVEHAHSERAWIADVLAIHNSGKRLAFEVQLSEQSEDEYIFRSQRYVDHGIGPVWVVPENLDWFRVKLPIIVTGFGKGSNLPGTAGALMDLSGYQPILVGNMGLVGTAVDAVLHPSFRWPHGTPQRQLDELARLEEARSQAEAEELERAKQAEERKRLAAQKAAAAAAEATARFVGSAKAPDALGVRPVISGRRIWASEIRCMKSGHPMLIWRLTQPTGPTGADESWMPRSENFDNVRARVDTWLAAAGSGLGKADIYRLQGAGNRSAFACPLCKDVIKGRWVAALPPDKWSIIAEGSTSRSHAREVLHRRPQTQSTPAEAKPQAAARPSYISENDFRFIGPIRKPFWMQEARDAKELAEWQAAKDTRAARMQAIRDNPRYRASPNGFRFECADCGGEFEDDKEGIHADGGCLLPGTRNFIWR